MKLSKIDVAEAQIRSAVRMFFEGQHPVPIFTLANAAREIVASIGEQTDVRTVQSDLAERRGVPVKKFVQPISRIANFFKHADRDADAYLEFDEDDLEVVLQLACHDFGRVTGGMPIEAQIYEVWVTTAGRLYGADSQGRKTCQSTSPTTDQIRSADQPQNREGTRHRSATNPARSRRRGDRLGRKVRCTAYVA